MLKNSQIDNTEGAVVAGLIGLAIVSLIVLGLGAKEIVLGISMGLVGFLRNSKG